MTPFTNRSICILQETEQSIPAEVTHLAESSLPEEFNDRHSDEHRLELPEQDEQSLDLLTVDDAQMMVPKAEKDLAETYDEECLDLEHDSSVCIFNDQFVSFSRSLIR